MGTGIRNQAGSGDGRRERSELRASEAYAQLATTMRVGANEGRRPRRSEAELCECEARELCWGQSLYQKDATGAANEDGRDEE